MPWRRRSWFPLTLRLSAAAIVLFAWPACTGAQIITEYPVPIPPSAGPVPTSIAPGPDGALWFTVENCSNAPQCDPTGQIGRITTAGSVTTFSVSEPIYIAAGPDGALWFTQDASIGRITTAGVVTEYPAPSGSLPTGIVDGPDGAL
jgi:virginiamycin B lyase